MKAFTGTWRLARLAFRRDRVKMFIWIFAIVGLIAVTIPSIKEIYAGSEHDRQVYATTTASSMITRVLSGPIGGPDIGSIVLNESYLFAVIMTAFMSTLSVVRHTRQNEETGRAELIGSAVVGRYAMLTAALIVTVWANLLLGVLIALSLMAGDLSLAGSVATGAAVAATGVVFAGVAAVAAQLSESARSANGLAAVAIALAFLTRGIGDGLGDLSRDGMSLVSTWMSYLSPIGWGQQIFPYTQGRWWLLSLFAAAFVVLLVVAFLLTSRRDLGASLLPSRPGRAFAQQKLLNSFGLAWRLQRATFRGWMVAIISFGIMTGLMVKEFRDMLDQNEAFADLIKQLGGDGDAGDVMISAMISMAGLMIAGYVIHGLQRLRSEESTGHLEPVLAASVGRFKWMLSHLVWVVLGALVLCLAMGLGTGVSYVLYTGVEWAEVASITAASFVPMPAVLTVAGFAALSFGLMPGASIGLTWGAFAGLMVIMQLGVMLDLPQWVMNISPFTHIPGAPAESVTAMPLLALTLVGLALALAGLTAFRRRDITTS